MPKRMAEIYSVHYKRNREGRTPASSISSKLESWLHKKVANDLISPVKSEISTLELGAGTLNQLLYEPDVGPYDIVEPFTDLFMNSSLLKRVRNTYKDISEVPENRRYHRITSVATLEHICNLPEVIAKSGLLMTENGVFRASIPSEGTLPWLLGWKLTTGLEFRLKYRMDYGLLMRHEHVNTASEIEFILKFFFRNIRTRLFGFTRNLSLYRFHECRNPKIERCREFLKELE